MKKYLLIAISVLLIVAAVYCLPESMNPDVVAGPGNGSNYKIKDVESFNEVLDYFVNGGNSSIASANDGVQPMAAEIIRASGHSSGTITEESSATISQTHKIVTDYDYYTDSYTYETIGTTFTSFNRSLTVYMDGNNSYYISKGMLKTNYTSYRHSEGDSDYSLKMVWDFKMLIEGNKMYVKFDSFIYEMDGNAEVDISDIIGKWVQVPDESSFAMIALVDEINRSTLESIQYIINNNLEDMNKSGDVYNFTTSMYSEKDTRVTLDLSNEETSTVKMVVSANEDGTSVDMRDIITFSNIDNTVVENNISDAEKLSADEFDKLFGGIS